MMKFHRTLARIIFPALLIAALASTARSAPLTTLNAIHSLTNQQASGALPVSFPATVTYYVRGNVDVFVQDGNNAIYVETTPDQTLVPGDQVLVVGTTRARAGRGASSARAVFRFAIVLLRRA